MPPPPPIKSPPCRHWHSSFRQAILTFSPSPVPAGARRCPWRGVGLTPLAFFHRDSTPGTPRPRLTPSVGSPRHSHAPAPLTPFPHLAAIGTGPRSDPRPQADHSRGTCKP